MAAGKAVWGIDIGQCALKALKVRAVDERQIEVLGFDVIEHPKILSQPDAEPDELIRAAIEKFASRNDWQHDDIVLGVPGQQTFARFCKLPPVEQKKIPDIVRFEAGQQIPFDMDDVVWDYEVFTTPDSPETEVGIFAMRKDLVRKQIGYLGDFGLSPAAIQTIPSALYNFAAFESGKIEPGTAVVIVDVGAQNTDLVIVESNGAWTRNIPIGGNNFTEALMKSFKLSFAKAESLKRTATTSKYARQIFQAMRPVFAELVAEIQRSLGFYSSTHRDVELKQVMALGNAFRLTGLPKYLENNLTVAGGVLKLEQFKTLTPSATINAPQFTDNILSFAAAYGLGLQGLGLARIKANLLPTDLARVVVWRRKTPYWIATAACLGLAAVSPWSRQMIDTTALASGTERLQRARTIVSEAERMQQQYSQVAQDTSAPEEKIKRLLDLQKHKFVIPRLIEMVHRALPEVDERLNRAQTADDFKRLVRENPELNRARRKQVIIESFQLDYAGNIESYQPGTGGGLAAPAPMMGMGMGGMGMGGRPPGMGGPPAGIYGGGMRPPMYGGTGGGYGGGAGYGGGTGGGDAGVEGAEGEDGFYVRLRGRLLYGTSQAEAYAVITEELYKRLQDFGQASGLGFHVLPVKEDGPAGHFDAPQVLRFGGAAVGTDALPGMMPGLPGAAPTPDGEPQIDPRFVDPVTGENMMNDWLFEFGFKVRLGEKPAEGETSPASE